MPVAFYSCLPVSDLNCSVVLHRLNICLGIGSLTFGGDGGQATAAALRNPEGIFGTSTGLMYIADSCKYLLFVCYLTNIVSIVQPINELELYRPLASSQLSWELVMLDTMERMFEPLLLNCPILLELS